MIVPALPGTSAAQVALGAENACARTNEGRVVCWGAWGSDKLLPTYVVGIDDAIEIAVGTGHACARRRTGTVTCWGNNGSWWEASTSTLLNEPEEVAGWAGAIQLGHGAFFACTLGFDRLVRCAGSNAHGQLGDGTLVGRATPKVVPGLTRVAQIAVGASHACARLDDATVRCWGNNDEGQLGDGTDKDRAAPVAVTAIRGAVELAAGDGLSCMRDARGEVHCWGRAQTLEEADPSFKPHGGPGEKLVMPWKQVDAIAVGDHVVCGRLASGNYECLGGLPEMRRALSNIHDISEVAALQLGVRFGCVRSVRGDVGCWGDNQRGQLGHSSDQRTPARVLDLVYAARLAAGSQTTCAVFLDGTARCWGQVQLSANASSYSPAPVAVPGWSDVTRIAADQGLCAVTTDGHIRCTAGSASVPPLEDVVDLVMTRAMSCARRRNNDVVCWDTYHREPAVIARRVTQLAGTYDSMCALLADQRVVCWEARVLEDKKLTEVPGLRAIEIAVGGGHACARLASGEVRCWGDGGHGERGDGKTMSDAGTTKVPVPVAGVANATAITAGAHHTCALLADRTVSCWGWNMHGQLGDGTTEDSALAHHVVDLRDVRQIVAHGAHTCALMLPERMARCWGEGEAGQLGWIPVHRDPRTHVTRVVW